MIHKLSTSEGNQDVHAAAERLERGDVLYFPQAPFALPSGPDLEFLLNQRLARLGHKNIGYNPSTTKVAGFRKTGADQEPRLRQICQAFSNTATAWLAEVFPHYHSNAELDRVSYRPEREETRRLQLTSRNDLLHVDAFPGRPSQGRRILRIFANINPVEPRIWVTGEPFSVLLRKYGERVGLPGRYREHPLRQLRQGLSQLLRPGRPVRSPYDCFMLRLHDWLKKNDAFQKGSPRRQWEFLPNSVWVAFTDTCSHAVLRGRYALEHSYFIRPEGLRLPEESPPALLARRCEPSARAA